MTAAHVYLSTACAHNLCGSCRQVCKFCPSSCTHECHPQQPGVLPVADVDQARDIARELCDVLGGWRALTGLHGDIGERAANDPALFWLRGEEAPPGEWHPPTQGDR